LEVENKSAQRQELAIPVQRLLSTGDGTLQNGVAKLVMTVAELLRQVLERQALSRLEDDSLSNSEVERLGLAFMELKSRIEELSKEFGLKKDDLSVAIGSLLKTGNRELDEVSLVDVIDRLIKKGVVLAGSAAISVADVDLVGLDLYVVLRPISSKT
jgi:hypothetical protein